MTGGGDTPGDFWSRRKAAVRAAEEAEQAERTAEAVAEERSRLEEMPDEEILEELGLPDPDSLNESDDFKRFLGAAVPERLRRRALRRLWTLNPVLANLDGLVDYAEDYTDAATVISDMQTVYQVGKGMFDKFAELTEAEPESEPDAPPEEDSAAVASDAESVQRKENTATQNDLVEKRKALFQLTQGDNLVQSSEKDAVTLDLEESALDEQVDIPPPRKRRLRFDYS